MGHRLGDDPIEDVTIDQPDIAELLDVAHEIAGGNHPVAGIAQAHQTFVISDLPGLCRHDRLESEPHPIVP